MAYRVAFKPIFVNPNRIDPRTVVAAQDYVRGFMDARIKEIKVYPPRPPHSRYVRTGRLFAGWFLNIVQLPDAYTVEAVKLAHDTRQFYMQKVQGRQQLPMHALTGWERIDENVVNHRAVFVGDLRRIFGNSIRKGP